MPPRLSQIVSITKPKSAVMTHAINAAHSIRHLLEEFRSNRVPRSRLRKLRAEMADAALGHDISHLAAPAVRDRCPPVASEGLRAEADAGRRLAALVLGAVDHRDGALDDVRVEAV